MKEARVEGGIARAYLEILRVFLIPSAIADSHAGLFAAALARGAFPGPASVLVAAAASACAYASGLVINDVLDARKDRTFAPRRPIPSGRITPGTGILLGGVLAAGGIALGLGSGTAPVVASLLAMALLYDAGAKRIPILGDLTMGLCRGGNFLLGAWVAIGASALSDPWLLAGAGTLAVYVASITWVSRLEDLEDRVERCSVAPDGTRLDVRILARLSAALLVPPALVAARPGDPIVWANALALLALLAAALKGSRTETDARRRTAAVVGRGIGAIYLVDAGLLLALAPPGLSRLVPLGVIYALFGLAAALRRSAVRHGGEAS